MCLRTFSSACVLCSYNLFSNLLVTTFVVVGYIEHVGSLKYLTAFRKQEIQNNRYPIFPAFKYIMDRPFNLKGGGGGMVFYFAPKKSFGQHKSYNIYFLSHKARHFFPEFNIRLYDKNSESDYFFFLHQNQDIFFSNIGNLNIFLEKKHNPPFKLNDRSLIHILSNANLLLI